MSETNGGGQSSLPPLRAGAEQQQLVIDRQRSAAASGTLVTERFSHRELSVVQLNSPRLIVRDYRLGDAEVVWQAIDESWSSPGTLGAGYRSTSDPARGPGRSGVDSLHNNRLSVGPPVSAKPRVPIRPGWYPVLASH